MNKHVAQLLFFLYVFIYYIFNERLPLHH